MKSKIRMCKVCNLYTLKHNCPICGRSTSSTKPARFSPVDRYGRYRRALLHEVAI